jgi:hypothetical protein
MDPLERRVREKNLAVWLFGFVWLILSGVGFYLLYPVINLLGVFMILGVTTIVVDIIAGRVTKARGLMLRNAVVYPFGVVIAVSLNCISRLWFYVEGTTLQGFAIMNYIFLGAIYIIAYSVSMAVLKRTTEYETSSQNPIGTNSFYVKSTKKNAAQLLQDIVEKTTGVLTPEIAGKEDTWLRFHLEPNEYAVAFVPISGDEFEVDIFSWRDRNDILCEADDQESDLVIAMIDGVFATRRNQGHIEEWRTEKTPKYAGQLEQRLFDVLVLPQPVFDAELVRTVLHRGIELIRKYLLHDILHDIIVIVLTLMAAHFVATW